MHGSFIVMFMNQVYDCLRHGDKDGDVYVLALSIHYNMLIIFKILCFFVVGMTTNNIVNDNLLKFKKYGQNIVHMCIIYHLIISLQIYYLKFYIY
jgi:hypothetical protein